MRMYIWFIFSIFFSLVSFVLNRVLSKYSSSVAKGEKSFILYCSTIFHILGMVTLLLGILNFFIKSEKKADTQYAVSIFSNRTDCVQIGQSTNILGMQFAYIKMEICDNEGVRIISPAIVPVDSKIGQKLKVHFVRLRHNNFLPICEYYTNINLLEK